MTVMNSFEDAFAHSLIRRGYSPFRPVKDNGVDFLAVDGRTEAHVRFQVKGSRLHGGGQLCKTCGGVVAGRSGGWFDLDVVKCNRQASMTDFYVFIWPHFGHAGRSVLDQYLIVPTQELVRRIHASDDAYPSRVLWRPKANPAKARFRPWFVIQESGGQVFDLARRARTDQHTVAGTLGDYTDFYRNWTQVEEFTGRMRMAATLM